MPTTVAPENAAKGPNNQTGWTGEGYSQIGLLSAGGHIDNGVPRVFGQSPLGAEVSKSVRLTLASTICDGVHSDNCI